jgi:hypothetical protein
MGNAPSRKRTPEAAWNWNFKNGRAAIKPRVKAPAAKPRPLFKKMPSDDYNWWIFNPDPPRRPSINRSSRRR